MQQWHMPIGYKMIDGRIVLDKEKAEVVKKIFINYINGSSLIKIAQELTAAGFPNANNKPSWNHGSVGRILENIKYMGDAVYPQIIDEKTFESAQKRRESRNKKLGRTPEINSKKNQSIFIGKLICGECNEFYRKYSSHRGKPEEKTEWKCNNETYHRRMKCRNLILNDKDIESIFISAVNKVISRMWVLDKEKKKEPPKITMEIRNMEERIRELEEEEQFSSEELAKLVFKRAQAYYNISKIDDYDANTQKIKEEFIKRKLLIEFEENLFTKIIKQILIYKDGRSLVEFINGLTMEEEYENIRKDE